MSAYIKQQKDYDRRGTGIRLINAQSKLDLGLRELKFERELAQMKLPDDAREVLNMAIRERERGLEYKYNLVFLWVNLQKRGKFWELFGCASIHELLAMLDLPNGNTLGMWEILVRLFSKETFLLVGDETLGYMALNISRYQSDTELRKRDYKQIFEAYCKGSDAFDKTKFYEIVHWYINKTYVKPTGVKVSNMTEKPSRKVAKGVATYRAARTVEVAEQSNPIVERDFIVEQRLCAGCIARAKTLDAAKEHIAKLESLIRRELGAQFVPQRPSVLRAVA